jgi:hypothetical protein
MKGLEPTVVTRPWFDAVGLAVVSGTVAAQPRDINMSIKTNIR